MAAGADAGSDAGRDAGIDPHRCRTDLVYRTPARTCDADGARRRDYECEPGGNGAECRMCRLGDACAVGEYCWDQFADGPCWPGPDAGGPTQLCTGYPHSGGGPSACDATHSGGYVCTGGGGLECVPCETGYACLTGEYCWRGFVDGRCGDAGPSADAGADADVDADAATDAEAGADADADAGTP